VTLRDLLATYIISEPLRPLPAQSVLDHLREHQREIAIAFGVWHELWYGCYRLPPSAKRTVIEPTSKMSSRGQSRSCRTIDGRLHGTLRRGRGWQGSVGCHHLPTARLLPSRQPMT
jgi:hypothetical protein